MTPADRKELCAILRRVRAYVQGVEDDATNAQIDAMKAGRSLDGEINHIESEEPCSGSDSQLEPLQPLRHVLESALGTATSTRRGEVEPCPTTEPNLSGASSTESGLTPVGSLDAQTADNAGSAANTTISCPRDLAAIRKAWNRLRDAREGYLRSERRCEDVRPIGEAVAALLALDVPAVVAALMDEAKGERYVAGCERADRLDAEARADLAEGKCVRLERDLAEAKEQRDDALIRAEKAETTLTGILKDRRYEAERADKAEQERDDWKRKHDAAREIIKDREQACLEARKERDEARAQLVPQSDLALLKQICRGREMSALDWEKVRAEIGEARDKALEDVLNMAGPSGFGMSPAFAAAIRAMKGKP